MGRAGRYALLPGCVFSDQADLFANIRAHILDGHGGTLRREPQLLLMEELREPRNYFSLLHAIAQGATRLNEISQAARVGRTSHDHDPLPGHLAGPPRGAAQRACNREPPRKEQERGLYRITDAFQRFWFHYVHPNQGSLDLDLADAVLAQRVRPTFDQFARLRV